MNHFKLRVTWCNTSTTLSEFDDLLQKVFMNYAYVKEQGDSECSEVHSHYYLISTIQESAIRKFITKALVNKSPGPLAIKYSLVPFKENSLVKGNALYSLKKLTFQSNDFDCPPDTEFCLQYLAYMTKQTIPFINGPLITDLWMTMAIDYNTAVQADILLKSSTKKADKVSFYDGLMSYCISQFDFDRETAESLYPLVYKAVYDGYYSAEKKCSTSILDMTTHSIMMRICSDYQRVCSENSFNSKFKNLKN